jgi:hypothetical protein
VLAVFGTLLRVRQSAGGASLWLDELALGRNILGRPLRSLLTEPLAYDQVAPPGFLLLEKVAVLALGTGDLQLRLVPLASSVGALAIFVWVAARTLRGPAFPAAVALLAVNVQQVHYAGQVKPYSTDVLVAVGLTALMLRWWIRRRPSDTLVLALAGLAAVWLSAPAVLVLGGLGAAAGLAAWSARDWSVVRDLWPAAVTWLVGSVTTVIIALRGMDPATSDYLQRYWRGSGGFPPDPASAFDTARWLAEAVRSLFGGALEYRWPHLYAVLAAVGALAIARRSRAAALMLVMPMAVTLGAALAHQYPISRRLVLFLAPAAICLIAAPTELVTSRLSRASIVGLITLAVACWPLLAHVQRLRSVLVIDEVRPLLADVRSAWRPGDLMYVHFPAHQAIQYYGPRYGFRREEVRVGGCHYRRPRQYRAELSVLRGRPRVWVLFAHALTQRRADRAKILDLLDQAGRRLYSVRGPLSGTPGTMDPPSAHLYDLSVSDPAADGAATMEPNDSPDEPVDPLVCLRGPQAPPPPSKLDPYW